MSSTVSPQSPSPPRLLIAAIATVVVAAIPSTASATEIADLGRLDFPNSGAEAAQEPFVRGVLLLHSFEYEDAREAFREAQAADPDFALAYWGEAMSHNHPLWRQRDRDAAIAALEVLAPTPEERLAKAPTERERGYLRAVEILFREGDKVERDEAYAEAMGELAMRFPEDLEARSFHALAILGTAQGERDFATYMRAAAIVEEVFDANPRHPGAVHYLIHSYDDPIHAPLGLRAARVYAEIAPAASHAQHMISHIYVALGRWADSVQANVNAWEVSVERREAKGLPVDRLNFHALQWLEYSLLQLGRFDEAREKLGIMVSSAKESRSERALWYEAAMRAAWVVETRDADPPAGVPGDDPAFGELALDRFVAGYAASLRHDAGALEEGLDGIRTVLASATGASPESASDLYAQVTPAEIAEATVMEKELAALLALEEGRTDEAIGLLEEATAIEADRPLEYGPPDVVKPSHELFGEVLLGLGRAEEAREQLEIALQRAPRRVLSLTGLARAGRELGDAELVREACDELRSIRAEADPGVALPSPCRSSTAAGDGVGSRC